MEEGERERHLQPIFSLSPPSQLCQEDFALQSVVFIPSAVAKGLKSPPVQEVWPQCAQRDSVRACFTQPESLQCCGM